MSINSPLVGTVLIAVVIMSALLFMCFKLHKTALVLSLFGLMMSAGIILPTAGIYLNFPSVIRFEGERFSVTQELIVWNVFRLSHEDGNIWLGTLQLIAMFAVAISTLIIIRFLGLPKRIKIISHHRPLRKDPEVIHASDFLPPVQ